MMSTFQGRKLVHLDLKGAPPKMDFLLKLLPHFRQWGATGILVEYEDVFPYEENLVFLQRKHAYSKEEIQLFQKQAENENLEFIPLVQTFGHLEFMLKHKKFEYLQEMEGNPMSICPSHKDSLHLVQSLVHQVIEAHEDIKYLHIGGDEVFGLGETCTRCQARQLSVKHLFLEHMIPLLQYIKSKWPQVRIIMWDDMIREFKEDELQPLSELVEPMIWGYEDNIMNYFPTGMFERFTSVFENMWIASSFKGSSGPTSDYVPIEHHINNHLSWFQLLYQLPESTRSKINGIAITGWSRYDHFATICELLPAALPCLALCLATVDNEKCELDLQAAVAASLGFSSAVALQGRSYVEAEKGSFPGANVCVLIWHLEKAKFNLKVGRGRADGWMTPWHEQEKCFNPWHLEFAFTLCQVGLNILTSIKVPLSEALLQIYDVETVNEWICVKVETRMQEASEILEKIKKTLGTDRLAGNSNKE